jgi:2-(1,2-epoxy-1,2-dihydrophenyl)acetyl-CoA isomerase
MLNKVLPDAEVLGYCQQLASRLAHAPHKTIALIKRGVNQAHELPLERILELEAAYQTITSRDPNFAEGLAAFRAKRAPNFNRSGGG